MKKTQQIVLLFPTAIVRVFCYNNALWNGHHLDGGCESIKHSKELRKKLSRNAIGTELKV